jgi:hypothetical protein
MFPKLQNNIEAAKTERRKEEEVDVEVLCASFGII